MAAFVAAQRAQHGIAQALSCRALGVSQSWYYKWRRGDTSARRARRQALAAEVSRLFAAHRGTYGSPRITADLRAGGWRVSKNTVAALMRELGLAARVRRRRKGTTRPGRGRWRAPDLVRRDFPAPRINRKWFGDGTQIATGEGRLHLVSVLDVASRRVLGFTLADRHDARMAYGALAMAIAARGGQVPDVIFHTDQGSEYTASMFRQACQRLGVRQSMGRPGSALDNAVIESWHSTLEFELRRVEHFTTKARARARVRAWIHDYNTTRRHSACHMMSPVDYERALAAGKAARHGSRFSRPQGCAGARRSPGRTSSAGLPACLRGLHLDNACAPALTMGKEEPGGKTRSTLQSLHGSRGTPAAAEAIRAAAGTLRDLRVAEVVKQDIHLEEGGAITYRTKLQLSFKYEAEH